MDWLALLKTILATITGVSKAVEVRTKPQEVQIGEFNEQKELRAQDFSQDMISDDFRYLKRRTEIDIPVYLKVIHPDMKDLEGYTKIVTERVYQYRYDRPIIFRSWIRENPK